jgi:hypothetical protein
MSLEARDFSFLELFERTRDLGGSERLAVFGCLPLALQSEAWAGLREHYDNVTERDFRDWCGANA